MSAQTQTQPSRHGGRPSPARWFEVPADNIDRAKFTAVVWLKTKVSWADGLAYRHRRGDDTPDGGLRKRQNPGQQGITNYIGVASVDQFVAKVQKLGGKVCMPKTAVSQMGYFAICQDTENNTFALWEMNKDAK
jgi:predicted enzyme related to lactoylglutathione lyase